MNIFSLPRPRTLSSFCVFENELREQTLPGRRHADSQKSIFPTSFFMAHVSVHYKIYLTAGHHRQPRNASAELEPNPSSEVDVTNPGNITPLFISQLPYTYNGSSGLAQLMFWSVTDGTNGQVLPAGPLTQAVGANPLTITAWYLPIGGVGG